MMYQKIRLACDLYLRLNHSLLDFYIYIHTYIYIYIYAQEDNCLYIIT